MKSKTLIAATVAAILTSLSVVAEEEALLSYKMLSPATALELAQATLAACRKQGYQISVAVVDRSGTPQVMLRDRYAGQHTPNTATRKAWTATSFRSDTLAMAEETQAGPQSGVRFVDNALMLGGGVLVEAAGSIVAAVGVSGAPSGEADDACARAGVEAIEEKLMF